MALSNADRLKQVLINLVSNAIKYNQAENPQVTIRIHAHGSGWWVDVEDNGGGVSQAEAQAVFEKFTRGQKSSHEQGAGLGLPISRAIMKAMSGDLKVEFSQRGTSFFRLSMNAIVEAPVAAK